jgi:alpha-galactosidase
MSIWIGASSNLLLGSDMTNIDDLGRQLLTSQESIAAAKFCNGYPIQPRNPGTGSNQAMQLQAWISVPSGSGEAYVLLTNLSENLEYGGYTTTNSGPANVSITLADLGLTGSSYNVKDVWYGNVTTVETGGSLSAILDDGESQFLQRSRKPPCHIWQMMMHIFSSTGRRRRDIYVLPQKHFRLPSVRAYNLIPFRYS